MPKLVLLLFAFTWGLAHSSLSWNGTIIFSTGTGVCGGTAPGAVPIFIIGACSQLAPDDTAGMISSRTFDDLIANETEFLKLIPGDWKVSIGSVETKWVPSSGSVSLGSTAAFFDKYSTVSFVTFGGLPGEQFFYQTSSAYWANQAWTFTKNAFYLKYPYPISMWLEACAGTWSAGQCQAKTLAAGEYKNSIAMFIGGTNIEAKFTGVKTGLIWTQIVSTKAFGAGQDVEFYDGNTKLSAWDGKAFTKMRVSSQTGATIEYSFDTTYMVGTFTRNISGLRTDIETAGLDPNVCNSGELGQNSGRSSGQDSRKCVVGKPEYDPTADAYVPKGGAMWTDVEIPNKPRMSLSQVDSGWPKAPKMNPDNDGAGQTYSMPELTITATATATLKVKKGHWWGDRPTWNTAEGGDQQGYECDSDSCYVIELEFDTSPGTPLGNAIKNDPTANPPGYTSGGTEATVAGWSEGAFILYDPAMKVLSELPIHKVNSASSTTTTTTRNVNTSTTTTVKNALVAGSSMAMPWIGVIFGIVAAVSSGYGHR